MNAHRALSFWATPRPYLLFCTAITAIACDEKPGIPNLGSLELTTSAPTIEKEVVTADGWTLKYNRFLVHVTQVSVGGSDGVVAASATAQILDQVAPAPKSLLSAPLRTARAWEDVQLQIGPAPKEEEIGIAPPVTEADRDMMQKDGLTLYLEGTLSKNGVVKSFKWGFSTDTLYKDCEDMQNGAIVRGLVVPPKGADTADVTMSGDVLFSDDLVGGTPRADAVALADADNDGVITLDELRTMSLEQARTTGAAYATSGKADVEHLGQFIENLTPRLVTRFRANGKCTPEAAPAAEEEAP